MSVQSLEYVITYASILKDLISALVWKDMSLNHHELVDREVMAPVWIVICIVDKIVISMDCLLLQEARNHGYC